MKCKNCIYLSKNSDGLNNYSKQQFKDNPEMWTCKGKGSFNKTWLFGIGTYHNNDVMCGGQDFEPKAKQLELFS